MSLPKLDTLEDIRLWIAQHNATCFERHDGHEKDQTMILEKIEGLSSSLRKTDRRLSLVMGGVAVLSFVLPLIGAILGGYIAQAAVGG